MTVREYIGARYVPIFMGDWDNTNTYEPLSIVMYEGNSYTSRQYVPTGIAITNEVYWASTGTYNAQVEAYRQEVQTFNDRITQNAQDIDALEALFPIGTASIQDAAITTAKIADDAITTAKIADSNVTSAKIADDAITTAKIADSNVTNAKIADNAITTAKIVDSNVTSEKIADGAVTQDKLASSILSSVNPYEYFKGHGIVIIGDSYAYGTGASDHLSGDTYRWSSILCNRLGGTEYNFAVGSTGFCDPGSGGQNMPFYAQVDKAVNDLSTSVKRDVHLVVIAGGVNDFNEGATYGTGDMESNARTAAQHAASGFTNAIVLVVPMLFKGHDANPRLINFESAIINGVCGNSGYDRCVAIKGAWTWNFGYASHYISDGLHPNDLGHRNIANRIYANILGGEAYFDSLAPITFSGASSSVDDGGYQIFHNGVMVSFGTHITLTEAIASGGLVKIGDVSTIARPLTNVCGIVMQGNIIAGIAIITTSGALYIKNTASGSIPTSGCFITLPTYFPKGALS